ncbi:hypothetical protein [Bradyrhizobium sp. JYMT SZCCT0428]|uniref:hypothetical protein n=1 Tax=Bradyrhizobium sp. JYMT SZCCT0428 TaxID=2807673 RepID=UPI001BAA68CE|nr:hypothetical protein [Bradyrhizobium sp. JYMT SZCCT0428]MBR1150095.1 hypothetical protein [Bradyrhizobium sp. JYMT SZCCT0428]
MPTMSRRAPAPVLTRPDPSLWWHVTREWEGETAFIVGGGPSVLCQDVEQLRARRVLAINSSFVLVPFADILLFGDLRWWIDNRGKLGEFGGRIVTCRRSPCELKSAGRPLLTLERQNPPGLAVVPTRVVFKRTSYVAAINLAVHLGCRRIIALGLDGARDAKGLSHHHTPHRWPVRPDCWKAQAAELATLVAPLKQLGVELLNASPGSAVPFWPIVSLEDVL